VKDAELRVTLSLGVAVLETELARVLKKPQSLLRVADQAVYAAKNAGRNCVRVFTPPPPENRQAA
jgi:PleD family two-component response regulator